MRKSLGIGLMLGWQDIRQSYRRSVFGQLWITIGMSVTIAAIGIVFGTIFGTPLQVLPLESELPQELLAGVHHELRGWK